VDPVLSAVLFQPRTCALRAPTVFSARIKGIRAENAVSVNNKESVGFLCKIADSARMVFIRAESAIRADGFLSAQRRNPATTAGGDLSRRVLYTASKTVQWIFVLTLVLTLVLTQG